MWLQSMEAAFITSLASFTLLNDKTAMLSIAWAMNHSVVVISHTENA